LPIEFKKTLPLKKLKKMEKYGTVPSPYSDNIRDVIQGLLKCKADKRISLGDVRRSLVLPPKPILKEIYCRMNSNKKKE